PDLPAAGCVRPGLAIALAFDGGDEAPGRQDAQRWCSSSLALSIRLAIQEVLSPPDARGDVLARRHRACCLCRPMRDFSRFQSTRGPGPMNKTATHRTPPAPARPSPALARLLGRREALQGGLAAALAGAWSTWSAGRAGAAGPAPSSLKISHQFPASSGVDGDFRDRLAR